MIENISTHNTEPKSQTEMGRLLRKLFQTLADAEIRYCVLRNYELLPDITNNDVDILVDSRKLSECLSLILQIAKSNGWWVVRIDHRWGITRIFLVFKDTLIGERHVVEIDILSRNLWRGVQTISNDSVLDTAKEYRGFWVASLGAAAAISFTKEYLQTGTVGNGDKAVRNVAMLRSAIDTERTVFEKILTSGLGEVLSYEITEHIAANNWKWLKHNLRRVRRCVLLRSMRQDISQQIVDWAKFLSGHLTDKVVHPSGMMIVLCGPDGSGKTSIAHKLQEKFVSELSQAFPIVTYRHARFGVLPELKTIYNWVARQLGFSEKRPLTNAQATGLLDRPPFHPLHASVYLGYYTLDYLFGYLPHILSKSQSHITLFDRYYYDFLIHNTYKRVPEKLRWTLLHLVPQPQLLVYLKGDPEVINKRKPELRPDQIAAQQVVCEEITKYYPQSCICRSDSTIDETFACVLNQIYQQLEKHSLHKLRGISK